MALFDFFRRNDTTGKADTPKVKPDIQEDVFTYRDNDYLRPKLIPQQATLDGVYDYLRSDYQNQGYSDCLTNSEPSYREENINVLLLDLGLLIDQTIQKYREELREIEFHTQARGEEGLLNLVAQLGIRKETINDYLEKLETFAEEAENRTGSAEKIIRSYTKGFQKGLVALTTSRILKTPIDNA
jgi:hypothetical protein